MVAKDNAVEKKAEGKDTSPVEIDIEQFTALVGSMSRFLTRLTSLDAFRTAKLGVAEWSALGVIAKSDGTYNKQLAKVLGITGQRANQLTDALKKSGMVTVTPAPDDGRKAIIKVSDVGMKRLAALNDALAAN